MKEKIGKIFSFFYFFILINIVFTKTAYAYIDPSTITYVVQGVAAVFIAIGAFFTVYRHKIAEWFRNRGKEEKKDMHNAQKGGADLEDDDGVVDIVLTEDKEQ